MEIIRGLIYWFFIFICLIAAVLCIARFLMLKEIEMLAMMSVFIGGAFMLFDNWNFPG